MAGRFLALAWLDGEIGSWEAIDPAGEEKTWLEGRGCFTTARVAKGSVRWTERHLARLERDAERVGLGRPDRQECRRALQALAQAAFPAFEGIVRLQVSRGSDGAPRLLGVTRPLGPDRRRWRAITAPFSHDGPSALGGAKRAGRPVLARAGELARRSGVEETLLFDSAGRLVEGARTNLFWCLEPGELATPPLERGGVEGVARALVLERIAGVQEMDIDRDALPGVGELICVNAVRGARPVVRLDARPVGDGRPGPWATRLTQVLETD